MKKTQLKDAFMNIRKQFVSFVSIIVISSLAVLTFLGIDYSSIAILTNSSEFYKETAFRDAEIVSTYLLSPEDMDAIRNVEGVSDVEGIFRTDGKVFGTDKITDVTVTSLTSRINVPVLVSGEMPSSAKECVIEEQVSDDTGLKTGDKLIVQDSSGEKPEYLTDNEFVITGIVRHPDHGCKSAVTPGNRYVIVLPGAFDSDALKDCFMAALVSVTGADSYMMVSDEYLKYVSETLDRLSALAAEREPLRLKDVKVQYKENIDKAEKDLKDSKVKLEDSKDELDKSRKEYNDGVEELQKAGSDLEDSRKELADSKEKLDDWKSQLDKTENDLADSRKQLDDAKARFVTGRNDLENAESKIAKSGKQLKKAKKKLDKNSKKLKKAKKQLNASKKKLAASTDDLGEARRMLAGSLHVSFSDNLGETISGKIDWADSFPSVKVDNSKETMVKLLVTKTRRFDMKKSFEANVRKMVLALGVSPSTLKAVHEKQCQWMIDEGICDEPQHITANDDNGIINQLVNILVDYTGFDGYYPQIADGAKQWDSGHKKYIKGKKKYKKGMSSYKYGLKKYNDSKKKYDEAAKKVRKERKEFDSEYAVYKKNETKYSNGEKQYRASRTDYDNKLKEYDDGLEKYNNGVKEYDDNKAKVEKGRQDLADGEKEYNDGLAKYNKGVEDLKKSKDRLEKLDPCHWCIIGADGNAGYILFRTDSQNLSNMCGTFASIFVLVGALVVYATVSRIIDEQRRLVGSMKAFGFYNREIFAKYLSYGLSATVIGALAGIVSGYFIIQDICRSLYGRNYVYGSGHRVISIPVTAAVFAGGIVLVALTVFAACRGLMKSTAITLMQDSVPKIRRVNGKSGAKNKGSLYGTLIFHNMLSDKKRVIVTIASIAGCCTLLVTGITLNFSINKAIDAQFDEIEVYDLKIKYDNGVSGKVEDDVRQILADSQTEYISVCDEFISYDYAGKLSGFELVTADTEKLDDFFERHDVDTNEKKTEYGDGVWVFRQLANTLNLKSGDVLTLYDAAMNPHSVKIGGIYKEHIGQHVIMSSQQYEQIFGTEPENNTFFVKADVGTSEQLMKRVSDVTGVKSVVDSKTRYANVKALASVMDYISLMFIGIAGMMAAFILLNLINMYINQKTPELTIMRINGFRTVEVIRYVSIEIVVSTLLGIVIGIVCGTLLSARVITLSETISLRFLHEIQWLPWVIAAGITILFTLAVSMIALRKVRNLKIVDVGNR